MNLTASYSDCHDHDAERIARSEAREAAARSAIEGDSERAAEAVSDYWWNQSTNFQGKDLLAKWTIALAAAEPLMDAIAHGDALPNSELHAFRELCRQIEEAKRRMAEAINEAVDVTMVERMISHT